MKKFRNKKTKKEKQQQSDVSSETDQQSPVITEPSASECVVRFAVHVLLLLPYIAHVWYAATTIGACPNKEKVFKNMGGFGGRWKYLTAINETSLFVYIIVATITDVIPVKGVKKYIWCVTDWIFTSLIFPISMTVVVLFWSLFLYDRELVYPELMDLCVTTITNHGMHTLPLIAVVIETVFVFHKYPSNLTATLAVSTFSAGYTAWLLVIYYKTDRWVYNVLYLFTPATFVVFCIISTSFSVLYYFVGKALGSLMWSARLDALKKLKQQ